MIYVTTKYNFRLFLIYICITQWQNTIIIDSRFSVTRVDTIVLFERSLWTCFSQEDFAYICGVGIITGGNTAGGVLYYIIIHSLRPMLGFHIPLTNESVYVTWRNQWIMAVIQLLFGNSLSPYDALRAGP